MVSVEATASLANASVSDSVRARELYKYYQPSSLQPLELSEAGNPDSTRDEDVAAPNPRKNVSQGKTSSPDTALTAFAQLVAWRTGCQRAMISVIDGATQYFIAESTKTIDLVDNSRHGPGDDLWIGCSEVSKAGRLCEKTIEAPQPVDGTYAMFTVVDMSQDPRFSQLPFVSGPPFLKFYAGTPLITKRGIPIGSLFVVDDRARESLKRDEIHFMGTMASTIMRHMEMTREVEEHRRGMKMSRGLASFVEGRLELVEAEVEDDDQGVTIAGRFDLGNTTNSPLKMTGSKRSSRAPSKSDSVSSIDRKEKEYSNALFEAEEAIMLRKAGHVHEPAESQQRPDQWYDSRQTSLEDASISSFPVTSDDMAAKSPQHSESSETSAIKHLFSRAANLIREAFEVDGGSIFYDAQKGFNSDFGQQSPHDATASVDHASSGEDSRSSLSESPRSSVQMGNMIKRVPTSSGLGHGAFARSNLESKRSVEVLGFSTPHASSVHRDPIPGSHVFSPFDEKTLHTLLRRYPRGKLWTFDEAGAVSSSSEDDKDTLRRSQSDQVARKAHRQRKRARLATEARVLLRHFPGVRQLLFVPLWDASRSRWLSGNFTWSVEPTRILSKQSELSFLAAFGNSVMAECSRIDTEVADQKKGDFIGSISHELRSPLHGILASAEFLGEEITEGFSKGLVETIDSCGRTLLDTINHILDFSKINNFEKNWRRSRRGGSVLPKPGPQTASALALRQADLPMINLFAEIDVAIVCEEIVEGVFAGYVFQNMTSSSFDVVPDIRGKMLSPRKQSATATMISSDHAANSDVAVILDMDIQNYIFTTQPGAFRRVIMNLLGNALKYTSHGYVRIKLAATEMEPYQADGLVDSVPRSCVTLTITDTGKGISNEFLRSKLFTPFAQENSLSSGTGLGLSIVRSIVALLEGQIQIKSEVGIGTEVTVTLPLLRELPKDKSSGDTSRSSTSLPKDAETAIEDLRKLVIGRTVSLHGFDQESDDLQADQSIRLLKASVSNFLVNWYGLRIIPLGDKSDIIVCNEPDTEVMDRLSRFRGNARRKSVLLALCSHKSRFDRVQQSGSSETTRGFLAKPIGPLKLARAIAQCLIGEAVLPTQGLVSSTRNSLSTNELSTDLSNVFEDLSLSPNGGEVLDNSRMAAGSENARKAIESPTPNANTERHVEFPFPAVDERPSIQKVKSMPTDKESLRTITNPSAFGPSLEVPNTRASTLLTDMERTAQGLERIAISKKGTSPPAIGTAAVLPEPRLLLVDDNRINLRLLRTYVRKRKYTAVDEAENGLEAVNAVKAMPHGYDIIFMDISMPILDGFGATRQIRQLERERYEAAVQAAPDNEVVTHNPALIIALTGLASSRDQSEAFTSGVDLFLTKPVSFKEVGKLMDNWEANRLRDAEIDGSRAAGV